VSAFLTEPWPWWIGGPALATVTLAIWFIERRLFGVSGSYRRALASESNEDRKVLEALTNNPEEIQNAMLAAAVEEFGDDAVSMYQEAADEQREIDNATMSGPPVALPRTVHLLFLSMVLLGGVVGGLVSSGAHLESSLGPTFDALVGTGWWMFPVLVVGGICIGFGVRMAGGCTSGHGLSGCSNFQPGSLVSTATFFGLGVAASFFLRFIGGAL